VVASARTIESAALNGPSPRFFLAGQIACPAQTSTRQLVAPLTASLATPLASPKTVTLKL